MAQVAAGPAGFDMTLLDITELLNGDVLTRTSTTYRLDLGYEIVTFTGSGFSYDGAGDPVGGVVTGISRTDTWDGQLIADVTGISIPVSTFVYWTLNGLTLTAVQTVFAGSDTMTGSNNPDGNVLAGLAGDDLLTGGIHGDLLDGGAGNNTIFGGDGDDTIGAPESAGANYMRAGTGDDIVIGGAGYDDVNGNQGEDTIDGQGGDDWLLGGQGNDLIQTAAGNVILNGNLGNDTVAGGSGADAVRGGQGDDLLSAGAGDDRLHGDRGNDTMTGGSGADTFVFSAFGGADRITDFNGAAGDRIQLEPGAAYTLAQAGADTELTLSGGERLVLVGVQSAGVGGWII